MQWCPVALKKLVDAATVRSFAHMPLGLSQRNTTNLFTIEIMLAISLTIACSRYIYNGVILHAHPVRGESHNQRNAIGEIATVAFSKKRKCARKIFIVFVTLSDLNKTSNRAVTTLIKWLKTEVFCCKSDIHGRPMRFSILCTPTDSSDKTQSMCSAILLCLFTSKYDINGNKLNYSTVSSNKFKYINM